MNIKLTYQLFPQFYSGPLEIEMAFAAKTLKFYLLIWTLLIFENILANDEFHPTAAVWNLSPHVISEMGGVLTIWGKDFAADNFNQFDPMLGNKVCVSH